MKKQTPSIFLKSQKFWLCRISNVAISYISRTVSSTMRPLCSITVVIRHRIMSQVVSPGEPSYWSPSFFVLSRLPKSSITTVPHSLTSFAYSTTELSPGHRFGVSSKIYRCIANGSCTAVDSFKHHIYFCFRKFATVWIQNIKEIYSLARILSTSKLELPSYSFEFRISIMLHAVKTCSTLLLCFRSGLQRC